MYKSTHKVNWDNHIQAKGHSNASCSKAFHSERRKDHRQLKHFPMKPSKCWYLLGQLIILRDCTGHTIPLQANGAIYLQFATPGVVNCFDNAILLARDSNPVRSTLLRCFIHRDTLDRECPAIPTPAILDKCQLVYSHDN